jgi:hypothetical protein
MPAAKSGTPQCFWERWEKFIDANPPYNGVHWMSGQEVAIRLIGLCFAAQVFSGSQQSTPDRMLALGRSVAAHASRIPPSLSYARAQNNNHLLVEAAGLYTAGCPAESPQGKFLEEAGLELGEPGIA